MLLQPIIFRDFGVATMINKLKRDNVERPIDWRYQLAMQTVRSGKFSAGIDDQFVEAAVAFLRRRAACVSWGDRRKLENRVCDIHNAVSLYESNTSLLRWVVEAAILARADSEWTARTLGISARTTGWYTALFYDVVDRLDNRTFIFSHLEAAAGKHWYQGALKRHAYFGGPKSLHALFDPSKKLTRESADDQLGSITNCLFDEKIRRATEEITLSTTRDRLAAIMQQREKAAEDRSGPRNDFARNIEAMLAQVKFKTADPDRKDPYLRDLESGGVGLYEEELMAVVNGEKLPPDVEEDIRGFADAMRERRINGLEDGDAL